MENLDIIEKINAFLVEEFEVEPQDISPEGNLKETLEFSLGLLHNYKSLEM